MTKGGPDSRPSSSFLRFVLHKSEIKLTLMNVWVGGDVDVAEVMFDLFEYFTFPVAKGFCNVRMYSQSTVSNIFEMF